MSLTLVALAATYVYHRASVVTSRSTSLICFEPEAWNDRATPIARQVVATTRLQDHEQLLCLRDLEQEIKKYPKIVFENVVTKIVVVGSLREQIYNIGGTYDDNVIVLSAHLDGRYWGGYRLGLIFHHEMCGVLLQKYWTLFPHAEWERLPLSARTYTGGRPPGALNYIFEQAERTGFICEYAQRTFHDDIESVFEFLMIDDRLRSLVSDGTGLVSQKAKLVLAWYESLQDSWERGLEFPSLVPRRPSVVFDPSVWNNGSTDLRTESLLAQGQVPAERRDAIQKTIERAADEYRRRLDLECVPSVIQQLVVVESLGSDEHMRTGAFDWPAAVLATCGSGDGQHVELCVLAARFHRLLFFMMSQVSPFPFDEWQALGDGRRPTGASICPGILGERPEAWPNAHAELNEAAQFFALWMIDGEAMSRDANEPAPAAKLRLIQQWVIDVRAATRAPPP